MNYTKYVVLTACLVMGTISAEEFTPSITIKNNSSKQLSLYGRNPKIFYSLPEGHSHKSSHTMLYLSQNATLNHDTIETTGWCLIDLNKKDSESCWSNRTDGREIYRKSPCLSPLISKSMFDQAQREHKSIVATIEDGTSQEFVGSIELVPHRGYLGGIWHGTKSFLGSFFGRP